MLLRADDPPPAPALPCYAVDSAGAFLRAAWRKSASARADLILAVSLHHPSENFPACAIATFRGPWRFMTPQLGVEEPGIGENIKDRHNSAISPLLSMIGAEGITFESLLLLGQRLEWHSPATNGRPAMGPFHLEFLGTAPERITVNLALALTAHSGHRPRKNLSPAPFL